MKRYDKYKDSGIAWIGDIPEHWQTRRLKNIVSLIKEQGTSVTKIGLENIESFTGRFIPSEVDYESGGVEVRAGDIVYGKLRPYLCKVWLADFPCNAIGDFYVFRCLAEQEKRFIHYLFLSKPFTDICNASTYGAKMPRVSSNFMMSLEVPLPPLSEQEAIVAYLEEKTSEMDALVAKKEELIVHLRELKQSTIAKAVTQGLDATAPLVPSGIPWLGDVPQHWEVKRLGALFTENKTSNTGLLHTNAYKFNYGTLVRKYEDVSLPEVLEIYSKYTVLREKDIVINGLNLNYDFISQRIALALEPSIITSAYLVLSPKAFISQLYYCFLFKAMDSKKLFHGMGTGIRLTLSYRELKSQSLPCPPLAEQEAIVAYIEQKTCEIDRLIECTEQEIARIRELKQSLIANAVTGRFKVPTLNN